jgi:hypothetical protein
MEIGITGSREGITNKQKITFGKYIDEAIASGGIRLHHGMCVGWDEIAADIAYSRGAYIIGHPGRFKDGKGNEFRALNCKADTILEEKTHFERNRDIVDSTDILIAGPGWTEDPGKGGTSYTISYAQKKKKPVIIIFPNGTTKLC